MTLNELRDKAFAYAEKQGFHENFNFGESLMLIVSELSEALEADRDGDYLVNKVLEYDNGKPVLITETNPDEISKYHYESMIKGKVEEELADALIRIFDLAGILGIDLDWHVKAKMAYNETRPYKHGKKY